MNRAILICFALFAALHCAGQQAITKRYIKVGPGTKIDIKPDVYDCYGNNGFDVDDKGNVLLMYNYFKSAAVIYTINTSGIIIHTDTVRSDSEYFFPIDNSFILLNYKMIPPNVLGRNKCLEKDGKVLVAPFHSSDFEYIKDAGMLYMQYEEGRYDPQNPRKYKAYDLKSFSEVKGDTIAGATPAIFRKYLNLEDGYEYKGRMDGDYVLVRNKVNPDHKYGYDIIIVNGQGNVRRKLEFFDKDFYPNDVYPSIGGAWSRMLRKLRNGKLYFLGADNERSSLVVAEVDLKTQ